MNGNALAMENVIAILDGLKKTAEGMVLHGFIARGLRKFGDHRIEAAFLAFANKLLDRYLTTPDADPSTRVRVKLIQSRLRPYLQELAVAAAPVAAPPVRNESATAAPPPVPSNGEAAARAGAPRRSRFEASLTPPPTPSAPPAPVVELPPEPAGTAVEPRPEPPADAITPAIESLPEQLARQMADTLTHGREFDELLRTSLTTLAGNGVEITAIKQQLAQGIEELISEHRELARQLASRRHELASMSEDRRALAQALDRARKHSLTDELTGLPNRTAFLRQLNAEIGRARRYGFSLALALIDIDDLKGVNARYGEAAGDSVLHTYAHEIMSQFRGYDLVARYGDDEFAVLLPNTQKDGGNRALEKAQRRVAGTYIQTDSHNIPLPSFSSVLTLYTHGEAPEALLKRADEALAHAKQRGPGQTVLALAPG
jgi:diguanylate cyclase (GGDEF)-like protein